ncbi:hypothetical protein CLU79DRAFT_840365 [Phycomyces nitens]|nr:hypothetical protein CLU79DRAFT_840365 [Phycomyces nitens]
MATSLINNEKEFGYNTIINDIQTSHGNVPVLSIDDFVRLEDIELPVGHEQHFYKECPKELLKLIPEPTGPQDVRDLASAYLQQTKGLHNLQIQTTQALETVQTTQTILSQTKNAIDTSFLLDQE